MTAIANRPVYRVLKVMASIGEEGTPEVLWEGQDLTQALRKFPVPSSRTSPSADPLLPYWSDSDNIFYVRHWWEKKNPNGEWEKCNDPRPLSGVLRQFERISQR